MFRLANTLQLCEHLVRHHADRRRLGEAQSDVSVSLPQPRLSSISEAEGYTRVSDGHPPFSHDPDVYPSLANLHQLLLSIYPHTPLYNNIHLPKPPHDPPQNQQRDPPSPCSNPRRSSEPSLNPLLRLSSDLPYLPEPCPPRSRAISVTSTSPLVSGGSRTTSSSKRERERGYGRRTGKSGWTLPLES